VLATHGVAVSGRAPHSASIAEPFLAGGGLRADGPAAPRAAGALRHARVEVRDGAPLRVRVEIMGLIRIRTV
jgi:hypothetical protein